MTILSSVDLPRPLGPMIATCSPRRTVERHVAGARVLSPYDFDDAAHLEHVAPARALRRRSGRAARGASVAFELLDLDPLDLLEAALRLLGLRRLGAEALHERALVGDDLLGARDLRLFALARGRLLDDERGVVARVLR